uniref:protein-tyrosine-phosphatase n=1 Tax=Petromyzon marinus TaxID=7757 RepID=A0AAJ7X5Q0_PETMA|nr:receptor-type tyrosine-protein phosphatase delta-like isoform X6 [Petromyzon marinus]
MELHIQFFLLFSLVGRVGVGERSQMTRKAKRLRLHLHAFLRTHARVSRRTFANTCELYRPLLNRRGRPIVAQELDARRTSTRGLRDSNGGRVEGTSGWIYVRAPQLGSRDRGGRRDDPSGTTKTGRGRGGGPLVHTSARPHIRSSTHSLVSRTMARPRAGGLQASLATLVVLSYHCNILTVANSPPWFTRTPADQTGVSGGVASFVCKAQGNPRPQISWLKKGKRVSAQRFEVQGVIEFDGGLGSVLRIQPLRPQRDEGTFECMASNGGGVVTASAQLSVLQVGSTEDKLPPGFPVIEMGPQLKVVERSRTATMLCAVSGQPEPEISWYKDFLPVDTSKSGGRIKLLVAEPLSGSTPIRGALQIDNSQEMDQGKYECVASNSVGTRYSAPANLFVKVRTIPPRFSVLPASHEIMPGGSVNLTCVAIGSPMPYVKWKLGHKDLTPEADMPIGRNVLELTGIQESGNYTCVAISSLGVIEVEAQITVKALPKALGTLTMTETTATSVTLTWDSLSPDPVLFYIIQYKLQSSEGPFQETDAVPTTRYTVGGLNPNSKYELQVLAVNNIGRGPPSPPAFARTGEQAPSSPPRNVRARMLGAPTVLVVTWEEPEEPNGVICGYRVYYTADAVQPASTWLKHNVDDNLLATIGGLLPDSLYALRVLAFTSVGDGPFSGEIYIKTTMGVPGQPVNLKAEAESDSSILLCWTPPHYGDIASYELSIRHGDNKEEVVTLEPTMTFLREGLQPDTIYHFQLAARSQTGLGPATFTVTERTMQSTPSAPPQNIACVALSSSSLLVSWEPPPAHSQHGSITGYTVAYRALPSQGAAHAPDRDAPHTDADADADESGRRDDDEGDDGDEAHGTGGRPSGGGGWRQTPRQPEDRRSVKLHGLTKWAPYEVTVRAHTVVGPGPPSLPIQARTLEDVPSGPPRRVELETVNSTTVRVTWRTPTAGRQHGQVRGYQVHYSRVEAGQPQGAPAVRDLMLSDKQLEMDDSADYELVVSGLRPESTYSFTVTAYTAKGDGARSKAKLIATGAAVPDRPSVQVSLPESTVALVTWQAPDETHGALQGYRFSYGREDVRPLSSLEFDERQERHTITGLHQGATYVFRVAAKNRAGLGEEGEARVTTPEGVPSGVPQSLVVAWLSASAAQLRWEPPVLARQNGRIVRYTLAYREMSNREEASVSSASAGATLANLKPDTVYVVKVQAHTAKGAGPFGPSNTFRTAIVDQAGFAKNFRVKAVMKTAVLFSWETPDSYGTPFRILVNNNRSVEMEERATHRLISDLSPDTEYSFGLTHRGSAAGGLQQVVTVRTAPDTLRARPTFLGKVSADGSVTVSLPQVSNQLHIRAYYLVVVPLKRMGNRAEIPWDTPDQMELDKLLDTLRDRRSVSAIRRRPRSALDFPRPVPAADGDDRDRWRQRREQRRRQRWQRQRRWQRRRRRSAGGGDGAWAPYVAARLASLPPEFTLGDERSYDGFYNRRLEPGRDYTFFLIAAVNASEPAVYVTSPYSEPALLDVHTLGLVREEEEGLLWVVGPVIAVLIIILVVIGILLYKSEPGRKRREGQAGKGGATGFPSNKDIPTPNHSDPVQLRRLNHQTPGMMNHPPIAVADLEEHVERLRANDGLKFSQEYESIDPGQQFTWEHSNLEVNKAKNRYANVIAYDHSRVILQSLSGVQNSDYINANYIDGYRKQNAYIATQGPLPETTSDFWRMVWEQGSVTIVMMTRLEERARVKCEQYWPSRGAETYATIHVSLLDSLELATYHVRTFSLGKTGSSEKREVRQFQFTAWPDHGVPEYPTPFLAFLRRVKACNPPDVGPMVVHCSAGVGRTGCFMVMDAMLERMRTENSVDVYGQVTCMRAQRNYMVQTEEQYVFVHEALLEASTVGCTEVPARSLYAHLQRLGVVEPGDTATGMELEFKRLSNTKMQTLRFITANLPCNKFKNRLVNVMPYESTRVALQPIRGLEGSDYINASYIDGYRQQGAYIATQGPLPETTEDFWRMLWEQNSTIVVMLTKLREMGREKCHQYWPAERSARYQYFVVDPMAEYNMPQYVLREFKVTDARDGQSRTVRQFQFTDWPEQGVPKSGEGFIDFIGQVHKTKEQFGQDGPITVHCSAGVGRTGVFVTLSIVLERMRYEGTVDVFQTVKMLRTQRAAMIQTEDQYQFCYQAALEYLGSFDHYAM